METKDILHMTRGDGEFSYSRNTINHVPRDLCDEKGKPTNRGAILSSETSPAEVLKAYYHQFQQDFLLFLNHRSYEVAQNGVMVISTVCRPSIKPWEPPMVKFLFLALDRLVFQGVIQEEKVDSFNLPGYVSCKEEIQEIVTKEGSFAIEHLEVVLLDDDLCGVRDDPEFRADSQAKIIRSFSEALVSDHFGAQVWNELYNVLYQVNLERFESNSGPAEMYNIIIFLRKK